MKKINDTTIALLIDGDNAAPRRLAPILEEVSKKGTITIRRIYGDWTTTGMSGWKDLLNANAIQPVQQFAYTSGKNATDSSLIIDAMDLMYTRRFDGFCLVSSDSDFTRLAQRLREEGHTVYGFGERKTPDPFVQACDKFIYTDLLRREPEPAAPAKPPAAPAKKATKAAKAPPAPAPAARPAAPPLPRELLVQAIEEATDDEGWAFLGTVGSYLGKIRPDFDPRLYGHKKLSDLFKAHPSVFEMQERGSAGGGKSVHVRLKG